MQLQTCTQAAQAIISMVVPHWTEAAAVETVSPLSDRAALCKVKVKVFAPGGYKAKVTFTCTFLRKYIHANNTIYKTKH